MKHARIESPENQSDSSTAGKILLDAGIGFLIFVGLNLLFAASWIPSFSLGSLCDYGWLHSRTSAICMLVALFLATAVVVYKSTMPVRQAIAFWIGVQVGVVWMTVTTYRPDDMWPIFLVSQIALTALATLFGMLTGLGLHDARKLLKR